MLLFITRGAKLAVWQTDRQAGGRTDRQTDTHARVRALIRSLCCKLVTWVLGKCSIQFVTIMETRTRPFMWAATERKWRQSPWQPPEERPTNQQTMQHTTFPGEPFEVRPWVIQSCPLKFLRPVLECLWVSRSECLVKRKKKKRKKKKKRRPPKTLCYSPLSSFKASVAECAREPASRVTATSKFPPRAISLQEMLTAAGEANARPRPFNTQGASNKRNLIGKVLLEILVSSARTVDDMRWRHETRARSTLSDFWTQQQSFSATSCSLARRHFLPASDHGCRLLRVSHAPCPSKQFVFGGAADLALNFSSRQKKKKKRGGKKGSCGMADAVSLLLSGRSADHRLFGFKGCLAEWPLAVGVRKRRSVALLDIFFSTVLMLFNAFLQLRYHLLSCWNTVNCTRQMPHEIFPEFVCCLLLQTHSSSREPT